MGESNRMTHHYSKFLNLMENLDVALRATDVAMNSQGSALKENAKYVESISGKMEVLKTTLEGVFSSAISSDDFKSLISTLTTLVNVAGSFINTFGLIPSLMTAIMVSVGLFNKEFSVLASMKKFGTDIATSFANGTIGAQGFGVALKGLSKALGITRLGVLALDSALTMGLSFAITLAVQGLINLIDSLHTTREEQKKYIEETKQSASSIAQQIKQASNLKNEYDKLTAQQGSSKGLNVEEKTKLKEIQDKIIQQFPELKNGLTGELDATKNISAELEKKNKKLEEELKVKRKILSLSAGKELENIGEEMTKAQSKLSATNKDNGWMKTSDTYLLLRSLDSDEAAMAQKQRDINYLQSSYDSSTIEWKASEEGMKRLNQINKMKAELQQEISNAQEEYSKGKDKIIDFIKNETDIIVAEQSQSGKAISEESYKMLNQIISNVVEINPSDYIGESGISNAQKLINAIIPSLDDKEFEYKKKEYQSALSSFQAGVISEADFSKIAEAFKQKMVDSLSKALPNIPKDSIVKMVDDMLSVANPEKTNIFDRASTSVAEFEQKLKNADDEFKKYLDNAQLLTSAIKELDDNHKISGKTLQDLLLKYPELGAYLNDEVLLRQKIDEALNNEVQGQKEAYKTKLLLNENFYKMVVGDNQDLAKKIKDIYGQDVLNYKNATDAKEQISALAINRIMQDWASISGFVNGTAKQVIQDLEFISSGQQGALQTNIESVIDPAKMEQFRASSELLKELQTRADKIVKDIDFKGLDTKESKSGDSSPADKNPEKYKNETDELFKYKQALEDANIALEKNDALQNKATSFAERNELLKQRVELLKQQRQATNDLAWATGELSNKTREQLKSQYGLEFDKEGMYNVSQYDQIVDARVRIINSMKQGDARDSQIAELDNFKKFASDYLDLRSQYKKDLINIIDIESKMYANNNEIAKTSIDELLQLQDNKMNKIVQSLDKLKGAYDSINDDDFSSKIANITSQMEQQNIIIEESKKDVEELGKAWWKAKEQGASPEELDRLRESADNARKRITDIQKEQADTQKSLLSEQISKILYPVEQRANEFSEQMENLGYEEKMLSENDAVSLAQVKDKMISATTERIKQQTEELKRLNNITDTNILTDEKFKNSRKSLTKSLKDNMASLVELSKRDAEARIKSVEEAENKIQDIIKKGIEKKKKAYDDELDAFKKVTEAKIQEIDRANESQDYSDELADELEKSKEIQSKINELSYDKSFEAFQKRRDLQKEKEEQDKKIAELTKKRNRDLEKQSLQDSIKAKEEGVDTAKKLLDEEWTEEKIKIEARDALINQSFKNIANKFPELFKELNVGINDFFGTFESYAMKFGNETASMAKNFKNDVLPSLQEAVAYADKLDSLQQQAKNGNISQNIIDSARDVINTASFQDAIATNTKDEKFGNVGMIGNKYSNEQIEAEIDKKQIGELQKQWLDIDRDIKMANGMSTLQQRQKKDELNRQANELRNKVVNGVKRNWSDQIDYRNYTSQILTDINGSRDSGIDGGAVTKTGAYLLHGSNSNPEWVFTNNQMKNFITNLSSKAFMGLSRPSTSIAGAGGYGDINLEININGNADSNTVGKLKEVGSNILEEVKRVLNKNGIYR